MLMLTAAGRVSSRSLPNTMPRCEGPRPCVRQRCGFRSKLSRDVQELSRWDVLNAGSLANQRPDI